MKIPLKVFQQFQYIKHPLLERVVTDNVIKYDFKIGDGTVIGICKEHPEFTYEQIKEEWQQRQINFHSKSFSDVKKTDVKKTETGISFKSTPIISYYFLGEYKDLVTLAKELGLAVVIAKSGDIYITDFYEEKE